MTLLRTTNRDRCSQIGKLVATHNLEDRTADWIAHNMVAWFSQRITVGESDWAARFDREKRNGKWAYRSRVATI